MSVLIKISRSGAAPRTFYFRENSIRLGEDSQGLLSFDEIVKPLLGIYALGDTYWVQSENSELRRQAEAIPVGIQFQLQEIETLTCGEFKLDLILTSAAAEVLARMEQLSLESLLTIASPQSLPKVRFDVLHTSRCYPLFPDFKLTIGKDKKNCIQIDLAGVSAFHCALKYKAGIVQIEALGGKIKVNGFENQTENRKLDKDGVILLEPLGLPLTITFP